MKRKLQKAYEREDYDKAKAALMAIRKELKLINESAVASLEEGLEESLTVQRLGLSKELRRSLKTTNVIESVLALVGQKTDKVDYWKNSNQKAALGGNGPSGYRAQAQQDQRSSATQETEDCDAERNLKGKEKGGSGCLMCSIGAATEFQLR